VSAAAVSFKVTRQEFDLIQEIVDRAAVYAAQHRVPFNRQDLWMDLTAVHANGCPLRLAGLLEAESFDFVHDVFGIIRHLDRSTGKLGGCFSPRYSIPEASR
jgi:hypothetical protein